MLDRFTISETADSKVINFVSTALRQDKLSGLHELLRAIAEAVDAFGCVLWQVTPGSDLNSTPAQGSMFVLDQWLSGNRFVAIYYLPLKSVSGHAVLTQRSVNVPDIFKEPLNALTSFQQTTNIKTMCSVPITFVDGKKGTVNVYRNVSHPFTSEEVSTVEQLASLVPALHQCIRDKVSLNLVGSINELINEAELGSRDAPPGIEQVQSVFKSICETISCTFNCFEVSLFLNAQGKTKHQYELMATTWSGRFPKQAYVGNLREGLTGWVLARRKPVRLFNLINFNKEKEQIRREYPDLIWRDSLNVKTVAREILELPENAELPLVSFMAAPILVGEEILGVIRCSTRKTQPYDFDERDLGLLTLVAAQIGRYTMNWLARCETRLENESWHALVRSVTRLNRFVQKELTRKEPNELRIFEEALKVTSSVISGAEIMDVRLLDENSNELYFATTHGSAWKEGSEGEIEKRKLRRFSVKPASSAGAHVFNSGKLYVVKDAQKDPHYSETFPFVKRMIIAPISVEKEKFGVLDIRAIKESEFPKHAEAIAELLGQQLGLYHYLSNTIGRLRKTDIELKSSILELTRVHKERAQTFEDLEHQLRTPIIQAYARIDSLLATHHVNGSFSSELRALRGLSAKAKRVVLSTGLFARLARGQNIEINRRRLRYEPFIQILTESASDYELLTDAARKIRFLVDRGTRDVVENANVYIDYDLLNQAVSNLLDNAAKYSFPDTLIEIVWGQARRDRFHITVRNKGLPIRSKEIALCRKRGWRGSAAAATTGEGSGIGLWIVDNIMRAHHGELVIAPTKDTGVTEMKLVFHAYGRRETDENNASRG